MALSYSLGLSRDIPPQDALGMVQELVGGQYAEGGRLVILEGLVATCRHIDHPISLEAFRDDWGFDLAVRVGFALKPEPAAWTAAEDAMSVAAAGLAVRLDSDAGFSFQGERKLLLRRNGALTLYYGWRPWSEPSVLARVPGSFSLEQVPDEHSRRP